MHSVSFVPAHLFGKYIGKSPSSVLITYTAYINYKAKADTFTVIITILNNVRNRL